MKNLIPALVCLFVFFQTTAQTASLTLVSAPCDSNGVIALTDSGFTPPCHIYYYLGTTVISHYLTSSTFDTLRNYDGAEIFGYITDTTGHYGYFSYAGHPAFTVNVSLHANGYFCPLLASDTATASGGAAPYHYSWYHFPSGGLVDTNSTVTLPDGHYGLKVVDSNGCVVVIGGTSYSDIGGIVFRSVPNINVSLDSTDANCTNGALRSHISGAYPPFGLLWSNGATTDSITGLSRGSYTLLVTDSMGCTDTAWGYIRQLTYLSPTVVSTPATCTDSDGSVIAFDTSGAGTAPYSYLWSNGATTRSLSHLRAGAYNLTITDSRGCTGSAYSYVYSTTPIVATYTTTATACSSPTGSATLTVSGGSGHYTIVWNTIPVQTGYTANHLAQGNYNFTITDTTGCVLTGTVNIPPVDIVTLSATITPDTCSHHNGTIALATSGGVAPLSYAWTFGDTTAVIASLPFGFYHVTVTDSNHCTVTQSFRVDNYSPVTLGLATHPACIFSPSGSISAYVSGGVTPYTYTWSNGEVGATDTALVSGDYSITVSDAAGCAAYAYTYLDYNHADSTCFCVIMGTVYHDSNANCSRDAGERGIEHIQMHCSGIGYTYTDSGGHYAFMVPSGTHTISQRVLSYYPLSSCQTNNISVTTTSATGCYRTIDFADSLNPIHDMDISTWGFNLPRPGFPYRQVTVVSNQGTVTEPAILIGYASDSQAGTTSFVPAGMLAGGPNWFSNGGAGDTLSPGAAQNFFEDYTLSSTLPLGIALNFRDSVVYAAPMSNWLTDYSPWNNVNSFSAITVGSFDPNFKEVCPKGTGTTGNISVNDSELKYMVHFQNTGTYPAENVVVKDTLSRNLDWTTLRPVFSSSPCSITMSDSGVVEFRFSHIALPTVGSDPVNSNGFLTYSIKTRHGLVNGDQIKNSASIYFDFNAPVLTNTTLNTIFDSASVRVTCTPHDTLCAGGTASFHANVAGVATPHYHWRKNGVVVGSDSTNYTPTTLSTGDVVVCSVSAATSGSAVATSDAIFMTIIPEPNAGVITGVSIACTGSAVSFGDTATGGTWTLANGNATNSGHTITGVSAGADTAIYTVSNWCGTRSTRHPFVVQNTLVPAVSITSNRTDSICAGDTVIYTPTPVNGGSTPHYFWTLFGTTISTDTVLRFAPTFGDVIRCNLVSGVSCPSVDTVSSNSIGLTVNPTVTPHDSISIGTGDSISTLGQSVMFSSEITYCGTATHYQWYLNRTQVPGATNNTFSTPVYSNDTVFCHITCNAPCATSSGDTSNTIVIYADYLNHLSVSQTAFNGNNLALTPNPNSGSFTLTGHFSSLSNNAPVCEIIDMTGKVIFSVALHPVNGTLHEELSLTYNQHFANGQYLMRIVSDQGIQMLHFVLER